MTRGASNPELCAVPSGPPAGESATITACTVTRRRRCRQTARTLEAYEVMPAGDVFAAHRGSHQGWSVEGVLYHSEIPPTVLDALSAAGLPEPGSYRHSWRAHRPHAKRAAID